MVGLWSSWGVSHACRVHNLEWEGGQVCLYYDDSSIGVDPRYGSRCILVTCESPCRTMRPPSGTVSLPRYSRGPNEDSLEASSRAICFYLS